MRAIRFARRYTPLRVIMRAAPMRMSGAPPCLMLRVCADALADADAVTRFRRAAAYVAARYATLMRRYAYAHFVDYAAAPPL